MVMVLTLSGLSHDETVRWQRALQGADQSERFEIRVQLTYDDLTCVQMKEKRAGFPDRLRLVKFDGSIKAEGDVVKAPGNRFTIRTLNGTHLIMNDGFIPCDWEPWQIVRASTAGSDSIEISIKLTTNMTSKSHAGRKFVFVADVRQLDENDNPITDIRGMSSVFELIAKHKMAPGDSPSITPRNGPQDRGKPAGMSPMVTPRNRGATSKKRNIDTLDLSKAVDESVVYAATWKRFTKAVDTVLLQARRTPTPSQHVEWLKSLEAKYSPILSREEANSVQAKQLPNLQEILANTKCRASSHAQQNASKTCHRWQPGTLL